MVLKIVMLCAACVLVMLEAALTQAQHRREVKVPDEIVQELFKDEVYKDELEPKHEFTVEGLAKRLAAESVDLNRDGKPEIIIHGINDVCGPYWCAHWIYRKAANGYQLLLDAGDIQNIEPQNTFTKGYRDVMAARHGSAFDSGLSMYRFDGRHYRLKACFLRHYPNHENARGRLSVSNRPRITKVKCEPE